MQIQAQSFKPEPIDTKQIENLKELVLTPELIVGAAAKTSKRLRSIVVAHEASDSVRLASEAPYDLKLQAQANWIKDKREGNSPYSLKDQKIFSSSVSAAKYFSTGTLLSAKVSHTRFEALVPVPPTSLQISNHEPYLEFMLKQNLLRDFLGRSSRRELEAGKLQADALKLDSEEMLEEWVVGIVSTFVDAWKLQQNLFSLDENVGYRERLVKTALRKKNLGTLEDKDFRKIEASLVDLKAARAQVEDALKKLFHLLVRAADLPESLLEHDVRQIRLSLGESFMDRVSQLCTKNETPSRKEKSSELKMKAARLQSETAFDLNLPELSAFVMLGANAVENKSSQAWQDLGSNPQVIWNVGLQFNWSFGDSFAKAKSMQNLLTRYQSEADSRDAEDEKTIARADECKAMQRNFAELKSRDFAAESLKKSYQNYEQDFKIGRSGVFEVIQAAEEWIRSRDALAMARAQSMLSWWRLQNIDGKIYTSLSGSLSKFEGDVR